MAAQQSTLLVITSFHSERFPCLSSSTATVPTCPALPHLGTVPTSDHNTLKIGDEYFDLKKYHKLLFPDLYSFRYNGNQMGAYLVSSLESVRTIVRIIFILP